MFGLFKKKKKELHPVAQHFCELLEEPGWKYVEYGEIRKGDNVVRWSSAPIGLGSFCVSRMHTEGAGALFTRFDKPKEYHALQRAFYPVHDSLHTQAEAEKEARTLRAFGLKEGEG